MPRSYDIMVTKKMKANLLRVLWMGSQDMSVPQTSSSVGTCKIHEHFLTSSRQILFGRLIKNVSKPSSHCDYCKHHEQGRKNIKTKKNLQDIVASIILVIV